ncbi:MAG TPA: CU044_5270 family protein, partial [Pilimelia sp.]|nr:CU044_5270 family protein [Pilimelia sp.]
PRRNRRLVLAAGALAAAVVAYSAMPIGDEGPPRAAPPPGADADAGPVLVPIAFEVNADPPAAGARLRDLAARLADAPYDGRTGRYAYHRVKTWGDPIQASPDGRHVMGIVSERRTWRLADGSSRTAATPLTPQFPDRASRDYWMSRPGELPEGKPYELAEPPSGDPATLPTDQAGIARMLGGDAAGSGVAKHLVWLYSRYVVPKRTRAHVLTAVAQAPGWVWRGQVTDRAGRRGVAITFDDRANDQRSLLVFDPRTGALLAHEIVSGGLREVSTYVVILETARTNQPR